MLFRSKGIILLVGCVASGARFFHVLDTTLLMVHLHMHGESYQYVWRKNNVQQLLASELKNWGCKQEIKFGIGQGHLHPLQVSFKLCGRAPSSWHFVASSKLTMFTNHCEGGKIQWTAANVDFVWGLEPPCCLVWKACFIMYVYPYISV